MKPLKLLFMFTVLLMLATRLPVVSQEPPKPPVEDEPVSEPQENETDQEEAKEEIESKEKEKEEQKALEPEEKPIPPHEPPTLSEITKIYIEEMPDNLHTFLQAEMVKKFKGRIQPVMQIDDADAIMAGSGEHRKGFGSALTGRWLGLHDTATGAITILCKYGDHFIWADEAGDRSLFFGVLMRGGPRKVASRMMKHMDKAIKKDRKTKR